MMRNIVEKLKERWNRLVRGKIGKEQGPDIHKRAPWMDIALGDLELDWREIPGSGSNSRIDEAFDLCGYLGLKDDTAWCGVYAGSRLKLAGYLTPPKCAWARNYTDKVSTYGMLLDEPKWGCIVNVERGSAGGTSHVGFLVGWDDSHVRILGGNQSDNVTDSLVVPRSKVLSFVWPLKKV